VAADSTPAGGRVIPADVFTALLPANLDASHAPIVEIVAQSLDSLRTLWITSAPERKLSRKTGYLGFPDSFFLPGRADVSS
jgi:hypothetical protein